MHGTIKRVRCAAIRQSVLLPLVLLTACVSGGGGAAGPPPPPPAPFTLSLAFFAGGFSSPVGIYNAGGADDRLFVIEQAGLIRIVRSNGAVDAAPFLDITDRVDSSDNEEGLLGLAFHPDYPATEFFYVNYINTTAGVRRTRIARFSVTADPDVADPNSEQILLTITQPDSNHNAGDLHFGPDDLLYIPMGDGGGGGDTSDNAQNPMLLLGKVIRIDVDSSAGTAPDCTGLGSGGYTVPLANPSVDGAGGSCDEIWATGFRNPWRSSFDRSTGDLYLGDVGQGDWEEVDLQEAGGPGGENYGWRCYEGDHAFNTTGCGPAGDYTFPIVEYSSGAGSSDCTVIGGYVYRGALYPAMAGRYLLTDYCSGNFRDLVPDGAGGWTATAHSELPMTFGYVSFGEDAAGELYVVNINNGNLYQVQAS